MAAGGEEEWWGQGFSLITMSASRFEDEALVSWWGRFERQSMGRRWRANIGLTALPEDYGVGIAYADEDGGRADVPEGPDSD